MPENKTLSLIQLLRGIASLLVVLMHVTINYNETLHRDFCFNFFSFGGSGVDIFFVLSGFIITYTSLKTILQRKAMFPFVRKRFIRIFPVYWITITLFLILQLALPSFYRTHYDFKLQNIFSTYLLLPDHNMVNGVSWTLTYELFFYLLFALVFLIPNKKIAFCLASGYALLIIILPLSGYDSETKNAWIKLLGYPMNLEFFLGVCAALLVKKIPANTGLNLIIPFSILFIISGMLAHFNYEPLGNTFNRVVFFGIPSFFIILGLASWETRKNINVHNLFLYLGEGSYSLYLIHLPVVAAAMKLIVKFKIQNNALLHVLQLLLIIVICSTSILFYKWIEKPIIIKLNTLFKQRTSVSKKNVIK